MALELIEDALGDPRNARTLALASDLVYYPEDEGKQKFQDQLGLDARLFSVGNTQAYLAVNDEHIVAAFRGTEAPTALEGISPADAHRMLTQLELVKENVRNAIQSAEADAQRKEQRYG